MTISACFSRSAHSSLLPQPIDELNSWLAAFDHYVLGPGTGDSHVIPPAHRPDVSRTAGWISPVLVVGGRVAGTFEIRESTLEITVFEDSGPVPTALLEAESARISNLMRKRLTLAVRPRW